MKTSSPQQKESSRKTHPRRAGLPKIHNLPYLGFGLGARTPHYQELVKSPSAVDWLEIISENFMVDGGPPLAWLDQLAPQYTIIPHGVSMSIGSAEPLDRDYLKRLQKLIRRINPPWFSDHLCWGQFSGKHMYNLLPIPFTKVTARLIVEKVRTLQDMMEIPFLLENVSSYVEFQSSEMPEWEFLAHVADKADCGILLDINNVYVSAVNHGFEPEEFLNAMPPERVIQYHIAGHLDKKGYLFDTHDHPIKEAVWTLFEKAVRRFGDTSVLLERDDHIPPLADLIAELDEARAIQSTVRDAR